MDTTSLSIQKFIDESFGNQTLLARALGIKPQAVQHWIARGRLPIRRAIQIEQITGGEIRLQDIIHLTGVEKMAS